MPEQDSIQSSRFSRMAALTGTGAKVGMNYLKYYGQRAMGGEDRHEELQEKNAADIYQTFSQLKGGPLKLAQMLSIDQNLLPTAYAKEFSQAQYSVPPLSYPLVIRTFRREFGKEPCEIFETFSQSAVSGASIGQVHKASLGTQNYAVKVQYPGVADSLQSDLRMVKPLALQMLGLREAEVAPYFKEVEERLLEETNYTLELERSQTLSEASREIPHVRFPVYYPKFSSRRILTMDWVDGITLDKFADSNSSQQERDVIGQALWDFYHHQIHKLRQFHADPHPGNFLVKDGDLWVLDFGCTKSIADDFYGKQFAFLEPAVLEDQVRLIAALEDLKILLPTDTADERNEMLKIAGSSLELLSRPFRGASFNFAEEGFMQAVYAMGMENQQNGALKKMKGARGAADSLYINRAYFGLYSLLSRLRATVRITLPELPWMGSVGDN